LPTVHCQWSPSIFIGTLSSGRPQSPHDHLPPFRLKLGNALLIFIAPSRCCLLKHQPRHSDNPTLYYLSTSRNSALFRPNATPKLALTPYSCRLNPLAPFKQPSFLGGTGTVKKPSAFYGLASCRSLSPIVDINLLLEPRGSESPASKKSSASAATNSTLNTRAYTSAPSAYTQSPAHGASPAYVTGSPAYAPPMSYGQITSYPAQATPTSAPHGPGTMLGGPVLPAISELHRHPDPSSHPQFRPLYAGHPGHPGMHQGPARINGSPPQALKRQASQTPLPEESPAKKQSKWTPEEDNLTIELRGQGMKWDDIAKRLPGRSSISCRLRYQNYLEKRAIWDEEKKNKLARLYARYVHLHFRTIWCQLRLRVICSLCLLRLLLRARIPLVLSCISSLFALVVRSNHRSLSDKANLRPDSKIKCGRR
jgi:hypothetical protein